MITSAEKLRRAKIKRRELAGDPADVLSRFCTRPEGRALRVYDDFISVIPGWLANRRDKIISDLFLELSSVGCRTWAQNICNGTANSDDYQMAASWLMWAKGQERP